MHGRIRMAIGMAIRIFYTTNTPLHHVHVQGLEKLHAGEGSKAGGRGEPGAASTDLQRVGVQRGERDLFGTL